MQQAARDGLTAAQVTDLLVGDDTRYDAGCDVVDLAGNVLFDATEWLEPAGSWVTWEARTGIHRRCQLRFTRDLDWGAVLAAPYLTLTDGTNTARFDVGQFFCHQPSRDVDGSGEDTRTVQGLDRLEALNTPIGYSYVVESGSDTSVEAVLAILAEADPSHRVLVADADAASMLAEPRVWELDARHTWLHVANALLKADGYQALWTDHRGRYRISRYQPPIDRATEWDYDTADARTILHPRRREEQSWWEVPNRWIFVRDRTSAGVTSGTDGSDGRLVVDNTDDGPTSQTQRGLVRTAIVRVDATDAAALAAQAADRVAADQQLIRRRQLNVEPNPLHDHLDVVQLVDDELVTGKALVTGWTLPLENAPMNLTVEMVTGDDAV